MSLASPLFESAALRTCLSSPEDWTTLFLPVNLLPSYALLAVSLGSIFAAGGAVGYFIGKDTTAPTSPAEALSSIAPGASPEQWAGQAFDNLASELALTDAQRGKVRPYLTATAERVFLERDRALLQMHLRLLEVHDTLATESALTEPQKKRLAASRAKLKASILGRFAGILKTETGSLPDL